MLRGEHQGYSQVTDKEISMDMRKLGALEPLKAATAKWSESPRQGNVVWTCVGGAALNTLES